MGQRVIRGLRLALISLFVVALFSLGANGLRAAPTDYTQTSTAYQTIFTTFLTHLIGVLPDGTVVDDAFFFSPVEVDIGGGDGGRDDDGGGPPPPTNLFRRNAQVNTWSNNLLLPVELLVNPADGSVDVSSSFLPAWGGPNYVGGVLRDIDGAPLGFGIYPLSTEMAGNGPFFQMVGSAFTVPLLTEAGLPLVDFPSTLVDFRPGLFPGLPINEWYTSAPFPSTSDNPGFLIGGTAEADAPNNGNEIALVFGASVGPNGNGGIPIPLKVIHDFGAPPDDEPSAAVTPLLADFDGDGCVDLVVLLDFIEETADDLLYTLNGNCNGNFDGVVPVAHNLGANEAILDLAAFDADNDGVLDLVISFTAPGIVPGPNEVNPGRIDYVFDPLGGFQVVAGPSLPAGMQPVFSHGTDCDQEQNRDDLLVTGLEFFDSSSDLGEVPPLTPSDVLCFLDGTDVSTVVYPKEKSALNFPSQPGGRLIPAVIAASQVGTMGCGQGWAGVVFYILDDNGGDNVSRGGDGDRDGNGPVSGLSQILMAEFVDCPGGGTGGGAGGGGAFGEFSGSGCLGSLNPQQPSEGALFYLALAGFLFAGMLGRRIHAHQLNRRRRNK